MNHMLIVDHKIYTLTAAERWYVLHADYRFADEYLHEYLDDSYSNEELDAEQPYPDYELDDIELPTYGATAADIEDILDDMPPDDPQDPVIW